MKLLSKEQQESYRNAKIYDISKVKKSKQIFGRSVNFTVPIEKKWQELIKIENTLQNNIFFILQFIDGARFMISSLSNFANNLSEEIQ